MATTDEDHERAVQLVLHGADPREARETIAELNAERAEHDAAAAVSRPRLTFEQVFTLLKRKYGATEDDMRGLIPRAVVTGGALCAPSRKQLRVICHRDEPGDTARYEIEEL